jgi:hypothetical protein
MRVIARVSLSRPVFGFGRGPAPEACMSWLVLYLWTHCEVMSWRPHQQRAGWAACARRSRTCPASRSSRYIVETEAR